MVSRAVIELALVGRVDWFKIEERSGEIVIKLWSALGFVWEDVTCHIPRPAGVMIRFEEAKPPLLTRVKARWKAMKRMLSFSRSMRMSARYRIAKRCWKDHPARHYENAGDFVRDRLRFEGYKRRVLPPEFFPPNKGES